MTNAIIPIDSDKCFGASRYTKPRLQMPQDRGSYLCLVTAELLTIDYVRYVVGTINVLVISLENGGHIVTKLFSKEKATKVKVTDGKRKATKLDLVDIFWPSNENGV